MTLKRLRAYSSLLALLLLVAFLASCSSRNETSKSVADQAVRKASDEGVVTTVSTERITIDGVHEYSISPNVESFIASSKNVSSVLSTDHRYVQVGLDGSRAVIWIATIGVVSQGTPAIARYSGTLLRKDGKRAVFKDGTSLAVREGVKFPPSGKKVSVIIDPATHEITEFVGE